MQRKINQHVDRILPHGFGDLFIALARDIAPEVDIRTHFVGQRIRRGDAGVANNFVAPVIVLTQQRQEIASHNMIAKVRRNVANLEPALRVAIIGMQGVALKRLSVMLVPSALLGADGSGIVSRMKLNQVDQHGAPAGFGLDLHGAMAAGDGFIETAGRQWVRRD